MTVDGRSQGERAISVVFFVLTALVLAGAAWFRVRGYRHQLQLDMTGPAPNRQLGHIRYVQLVKEMAVLIGVALAGGLIGVVTGWVAGGRCLLGASMGMLLATVGLIVGVFYYVVTNLTITF